ncbi:MAG: orotate phosphoribosyltransferase, partial [Nitrospiraceae bacterium]
GCTNNGQIVKHEAVNVFASVNFESLSQEMAQGQGEHLASLATLMGVPAEHQPEFFAMTQDQYTALMQAGEASPAEMVQALHDAIAVHPVLAKVSLNR